MARARLRIVTVRDEDILNNEPPDSKAVPVASPTSEGARKASTKTPSKTRQSKPAQPKSSAAKSTGTKSPTEGKRTTTTPKAGAAAKSEAAAKGEALPKAAAAAKPVRVADIMSKQVVTCSQSEALSGVGQAMWDHNVGAIVIVDDARRPVSVVTDRDLAMAAYTQGSPLAHIGVVSCMSKRLVTCDVEADAATVSQLMCEHQIRRIPVVDGDGQLVGIVGIRDLLTATNAKTSFKPADVLTLMSSVLS